MIYISFYRVYKKGKAVCMITNQDFKIDVIIIKVKVFVRKVDVNKWEIVCVVLPKGNFNVSRNL